jgi:hypothetical protein
MPSTLRTAFSTVTQSGAFATWGNLSNIEHPASGFTQAFPTISKGSRSNTISLADNAGVSVAGIPAGSTFNSMSLEKSVGKGGALQSDAEIDFFGKTNLSSGTVWSSLDVTDSFVSSFASGDRAYWKLTAYSPTQIIDKLKDGSLKLTIWAVENNGVDNLILCALQDVTLVVNYTEPAAGSSPGRRGAVLIGM